MGKLRLFLTIFVVLLSAYVLLSLVTFTPNDVPWLSYPPSEEISNSGGVIGAYLSYYLYSYLGLSVFSFIALGLLVFFDRKKGNDRFLFITGAIFLQLSICELLSLQGIILPEHLGLQSVMAGSGGFVGDRFSALLTHYFGGFGALIIGLLMGILSLSLMLENGIKPILAALKETIVYITLLIKSLSKKISRIRLKKLHAKMRAGSDDDNIDEPGASGIREDDESKRQPQQKSITGDVSNEKVSAVTTSFIKKILPYKQPPIEIFDDKIEKIHHVSQQELELRKKMIINSLEEFGVSVKVVGYEEGPRVTLYEIELAPGTRLHEVSKLADELSMKLMVPNIRIIAPLPGKGTVGVEVPNPFPNTVRLREFLVSMGKKLRKVPLPLLLGRTNVGDMLVKNLTDMPHCLIGGTTGSGKSICLKSLIAGLVSLKSYDELKLFLIDPKMVELTVFEDIPHLWSPVITDARKAAYVLEWLVKEMEDRYKVFNRLHVQKIETYNQLGKQEITNRLQERGAKEEEIKNTPHFLPYIVIVIDELADLMLTSGKQVESAIIRLSQKARAVGIHVVAATQRPSRDVVTGLIKSNMPASISFKVASQIESRIILDSKGAERLLGKGDLLFVMPGINSPIRAQCTFVSEDELYRLTKYLKGLGEPMYREELLEINSDEGWEGTEDDDMFEEACRIVLESRRGSISLIQRKLQIGYQRSARLIESMEKAGIVGPYNGAKSREVLLTLEEWENRKKAQNVGNS